MLHIENKTESPVVVGIFETNCEGHIVGHFVIPGGYPFYTTADVPLSFQDPRPLALCFSPALGKPFVSEIADVTASLNLKSP